jgi:hypothetical protein
MSTQPAGPREETAVALVNLVGRAAGCPVAGFQPFRCGSDLDALSELVHRNRLGGALYRTPPAEEVPEPLLLEWRAQHQRQVGLGMLALSQLNEIAGAFEAREIDRIALKGAASLLWVYADPGVRSLGDLDLLIKRDQAPAAGEVLTELGYRQVPTRNPARDALVLKRDPPSFWNDYRESWWPKHVTPYRKEGRIPVELHVCVPRRRGPKATEEELWPASMSVTAGASSVRCLGPEHFLLMAATHFYFDLGRFRRSLKGLVDLLCAIGKAPSWVGRPLDWDRFWDAAHRWEATREAGIVAASLNRYWDADIPGVPVDALPLSPVQLIYGLPEPKEPLLTGIADTLDQLRACTEIPHLGTRLRYLRYFVFPPSDYLRAGRLAASERSSGGAQVTLARARFRRLAGAAGAWLTGARSKD